MGKYPNRVSETHSSSYRGPGGRPTWLGLPIRHYMFMEMMRKP